ncbi:MAG: hypothetical protein RSD49_06745 [Hafnia sp.]
MTESTDLLGVDRWVLQALLKGGPDKEAAILKVHEALAFPQAPTCQSPKPFGYVVISPDGGVDTVPVQEDINHALDLAHDLNRELHPTHQGKPYTVTSVYQNPLVAQPVEILRLAKLLGDVARCAHQALGTDDEITLRGEHMHLIDHASFEALTSALAACNAEIGSESAQDGVIAVFDKLSLYLEQARSGEIGEQQPPIIQMVCVPQGWKLVPLKATEQMCLDAFDAVLSTGGGIQGEDAARVYRTMLASSPEVQDLIGLAEDLVLLPDYPTDQMVQAVMDSGLYHDENAKAVLIDEFRTMVSAGKVARLQPLPKPGD